jgi:hypothetical protein
MLFDAYGTRTSSRPELIAFGRLGVGHPPLRDSTVVYA